MHDMKNPGNDMDYVGERADEHVPVHLRVDAAPCAGSGGKGRDAGRGARRSAHSGAREAGWLGGITRGGGGLFLMGWLLPGMLAAGERDLPTETAGHVRTESASALDGELLGMQVAARVAVANAAYEAGDYARALQVYEAVRHDLKPDDPALARVLFNVGNARYQLGDMEGAREAFTDAARLAGDASLRARSLYHRGNTHVEAARQHDAPDAAMAELRESEVWFRQALAHDPVLQEAAHNLEVARRVRRELALQPPPAPEEKPETGEDGETADAGSEETGGANDAGDSDEQAQADAGENAEDGSSGQEGGAQQQETAQAGDAGTNHPKPGADAGEAQSGEAARVQEALRDLAAQQGQLADATRHQAQRESAGETPDAETLQQQAQEQDALRNQLRALQEAMERERKKEGAASADPVEEMPGAESPEKRMKDALTEQERAAEALRNRQPARAAASQQRAADALAGASAALAEQAEATLADPDKPDDASLAGSFVPADAEDRREARTIAEILREEEQRREETRRRERRRRIPGTPDW